MSLKVISVGFGRTGTMSLKLALEQLGLGPCHHMKEVVDNGARQVPLWDQAVDGNPDFAAIYEGYQSAVDWPTAAFWRELAAAYPDARIILSSRPAENWHASISQTIFTVLKDEANWPEPARPWFEMANRVVKRSLGEAETAEEMIAAFNAHEAAVKAEIPADRLLVHRASDGWAPLCDFLGVPVPAGDYPRTNSREEFFELMKSTENM